ncbi:MAG: rfbC [Rhodospirillaceae bacterium]|nr:MAG: rfbC [Rhodospirillaceae bacterium]
MEISTTALPGVLILTPKRFEDARGFFVETYNRRDLAQRGLDVDFVQDNQSLSRRVGTIRGLHFQIPPHAQAKLVGVARGKILDVVVDVRTGSPAWGRHVAVDLSDDNGC